jgi:hypothetical protein
MTALAASPINAFRRPPELRVAAAAHHVLDLDDVEPGRAPGVAEGLRQVLVH